MMRNQLRLSGILATLCLAFLVGPIAHAQQATNTVTHDCVKDGVIVQDSECIDAGFPKPSDTTRAGDTCNNCVGPNVYGIYDRRLNYEKIDEINLGGWYEGRDTAGECLAWANLMHNNKNVTAIINYEDAERSICQAHQSVECPRPPPPLITYSWATGAWQTCSAVCGGGTQTRDVYCLSSQGDQADDSFCASAGPKPAASQSCNPQACRVCQDGEEEVISNDIVPLGVHWVNGSCSPGEVFGQLMDQSPTGRHSLGEDGEDGPKSSYTYSLCVTGVPVDAGVELQWQNGGCAEGWSLIDVKTNNPSNNWMGYSTGDSGKGPYKLCVRSTGPNYSTDTTSSRGRYDPGASSAARHAPPLGAARLFRSEGSKSGWYVGSSANDDEATWYFILRKIQTICRPVDEWEEPRCGDHWC